MFQQGEGGDFSSMDAQSTQESGAAPPAASGGANLFSSMWQATQKAAQNVGAGGVFDNVHKKMNLIKASQLGEKLELIEKDASVEAAMKIIKDSGRKYRELVVTLTERSDASAKASAPLRKAGAGMIRCAGIPDRVARDMAAAGNQGFFKETPTYQQDLNEGLLVSSAALLYSADRLQEVYTTDQSMDASRASFEQGSYSTKYYVKKESYGPGQIAVALKGLRDMINNEIVAGENATRRYSEMRMDLSVRRAEGRLSKGVAEDGGITETEMTQLATFKADVLSSHRLLLKAKAEQIPSSLEMMLSAELEMHEKAVKSLQATLNALPNAPMSGGLG